jgi:cell division protein FtsL
MSYFLIVAILVAVIAVIYVWYVTRYLNRIPDDKPISLETEDDKLLIHWYNMHIKHSFDFNINDIEIAVKYLKHIYDIEINPDLIIIGTNLESQYFNITGRHLINKYSPDVDCIFDIRSTLAKPGEIAIIHDSIVRNSLRKINTFDFTEINNIMESELDLIARDFLHEVLKFRWEQITKLNDPNILNNSGSYLYLHVPTDISSSIPNNTVITVLGGVSALLTSRGARINLLCSNIEFETLIKRWNQYLPTVIESLS